MRQRWIIALGLTLSLWGQPLWAQSLTITFNPGFILRNPIDLTILVARARFTLSDFAWDQIQVRTDGNDISTLAKTALAGSLAVALPEDRFLLIEQQISEGQLRLRLHGFRAAPGPHQVEVTLPGQHGVPNLTLQGTFIVR